MSMISHTERLADPVRSAVQSVDFKPEQLWTDSNGRTRELVHDERESFIGGYKLAA
jgi:hypothetical protein